MGLKLIDPTDLVRVLECLEQDEAVKVRVSEKIVEARSLLLGADQRLRSANDLGQDPPDTMFPSRLAGAPHLDRRVVQWRADRSFPPTVIGDHAIVEKGMGVCAHLTGWAGRLMTEFCVRYSVSADTTKKLVSPEAWRLNAIHYPALLDYENEVRFPAHRDWGLFACYPAIEGEGLELLLNGRWEPVGLAPGQMLVYAGMAAPMFANRLLGERSLRAASHRVMQRTENGRSALIYYVDPPRDLILPGGNTFGQFLANQRQKIGQR